MCWGQIFYTTWLHFIGNLHHINIIMDFGRIYVKAQKSPYSQKWCQSSWSKTHSDIISSRPIVRAHGTTSHFWLMIQVHESHQGNFGSRGLEGQKVCSVKLQSRFWNPDRTVRSDRKNLEPLIFAVLLASRTVLEEKNRDPCEPRSDLTVLKTVNGSHGSFFFSIYRLKLKIWPACTFDFF